MLLNIFFGIWILAIFAYGFRDVENAKWYQKPFHLFTTYLAVGVIGFLLFTYRGVDAEVVQAIPVPDFAVDKPHGVDLTIKSQGTGGEIYTLVCYGGKKFEDTFEIGDNETKAYRVNLWGVTAADPEILTKLSTTHISVNNVRPRRWFNELRQQSCKT